MEHVATVKEYTGFAAIVRDGTTVSLTLGQEIYTGDHVVTGMGSSIGLELADGAALAIGEYADAAIEEYLLDIETGRFEGTLTFMRGAFSFVSGLLTKTGSEAMKINLPSGTIGIRGTSLMMEVKENGDVEMTLLPDAEGTVGEVEGVVDGKAISLSQPFETAKAVIDGTSQTEYSTAEPSALIERYAQTLQSMPDSIVHPGDQSVFSRSQEVREQVAERFGQAMAKMKASESESQSWHDAFEKDLAAQAPLPPEEELAAADGVATAIEDSLRQEQSEQPVSDPDSSKLLAAREQELVAAPLKEEEELAPSVQDRSQGYRAVAIYDLRISVSWQADGATVKGYFQNGELQTEATEFPEFIIPHNSFLKGAELLSVSVAEGFEVNSKLINGHLVIYQRSASPLAPSVYYHHESTDPAVGITGHPTYHFSGRFSTVHSLSAGYEALTEQLEFNSLDGYKSEWIEAYGLPLFVKANLHSSIHPTMRGYVYVDSQRDFEVLNYVDPLLMLVYSETNEGVIGNRDDQKSYELRLDVTDFAMSLDDNQNYLDAVTQNLLSLDDAAKFIAPVAVASSGDHHLAVSFLFRSIDPLSHYQTGDRQKEIAKMDFAFDGSQLREMVMEAVTNQQAAKLLAGIQLNFVFRFALEPADLEADHASFVIAYNPSVEAGDNLLGDGFSFFLRTHDDRKLVDVTDSQDFDSYAAKYSELDELFGSLYAAEQ